MNKGWNRIEEVKEKGYTEFKALDEAMDFVRWSDNRGYDFTAKFDGKNWIVRKAK